MDFSRKKTNIAAKTLSTRRNRQTDNDQSPGQCHKVCCWFVWSGLMVVMSVAVEITSLPSDSSTVPSPVATRKLFWTIISKCFLFFDVKKGIQA